MKRVHKKTLFSTLAIGAGLLVGVGVANVNAVSVAADSSTFKVSEVSFRLPDETYGTGVRFLVEMSVAEYTDKGVEDLTTGILVVPKSALGQDETLEVGSTNTYMEDAKSVEWTVSETDSTMMETYVYVHSIPENYYTSEIAVRAYIDDNDPTTDPVYTTVATSSVAQAADWLYDNDTSLDETAKKNLRDNYLTYDVVYHDGASVVEETTGVYNEKIETPEQPVKKGFDFGGWWNEAGTAEWDFDTTTVGGVETNLYAKWTVADVLDFSEDDTSTDMFVAYNNQTVELDKANDYVKIVTNGAAWNSDGGVVIDYGRTIPAKTNIAITYKVESATDGTKFVMVQKNGVWEWDYNTVNVSDHTDFVTYAFSTAYATNKIKLCVRNVAATYYIQKIEILPSLENEEVTVLDFTDTDTNKVATATYLAQGGTLVADETYGQVMSFKFSKNNVLTIGLNGVNGFVFSEPIVLEQGDKLSIVYNSPVVSSFDINVNGSKPTGVYSGYTAGSWSTFTYAPTTSKTISTLGFAHWYSQVSEVIKVAKIIIERAPKIQSKAIEWTTTETETAVSYKVDFSTWNVGDGCQDITYLDTVSEIVSVDVNGTTQNVLATTMHAGYDTLFDFSALKLDGKTITLKMTAKLSKVYHHTYSEIYAGNSWFGGGNNFLDATWKTIEKKGNIGTGVLSYGRQGATCCQGEATMYISSIEIIVTK